MVFTFLEYGALVDATSSNAMTALMWAVCKGRIDIVDLLLAKKAKVDMQDVWGTTALMLASQMQSLEMINMLIKKGADPNLVNKQGRCAMQIAIISGKKIAKRLEKAQMQAGSK